MYSTYFLTSLSFMLCASVASSQGSFLARCDGNERWNSNYNREELVATGNTIYDLAVSQYTGNIYIALYTSDTLLILKRGFSNKPENITLKVRSIAVDNFAPIVYLGCYKGLKIYDELTGDITIVPQVDEGIRRIIVPKNSDAVYAVTYEHYQIYRYKNEFTEKTNIDLKVHDRANLRLFVDVEGNYYYANEKNGSAVTEISMEENYIKNTYSSSFLTLAEDTVGRVFGIADRGVYLLKTNGSKRLVDRLDFHALYMCFDRNNDAVFATNDKVISFKFNHVECH